MGGASFVGESFVVQQKRTSEFWASVVELAPRAAQASAAVLPRQAAQLGSLWAPGFLGLGKAALWGKGCAHVRCAAGRRPHLPGRKR